MTTSGPSQAGLEGPPEASNLAQGAAGGPVQEHEAQEGLSSRDEPFDGGVEVDAVRAGLEPDGTTEDDVPEGTLGAPSLGAALEALLLVADQPIDVASLAALVRRPSFEVAQTLADLEADYSSGGRGFELREVAGGWRFYTRADCAEVVERFVRDGQAARLTQAALETLAVVAYRQPVSRARISAVRGVNVDGVVRTLTSRGLICEVGHDEGSGAILYATTALFLERLGIRDLEDLPPVADYLPEVEMLDEFIEQTSS
jgi:segregation and condensation protein B